MRSVSIIGTGLTKFGEHWKKSFREMIAEAGSAALNETSIDGKQIQAVYGGCMASGRLVGQEHVGALIADQLGLNPIPATRCEAACASGGVALRCGYLAIASGMYDVVAVGGVEKMTEVSSENVSTALGGAGDQEWELFFGATFPAIYALMARSHMAEFGTTEEQMAACAVKNHKNACHNPFAQFQKEITVEQVLKSGYVASPLKLLDCSPVTDGAAVVLLCASEIAKKYNPEPIEILASAQASDSLALAQRKNLWEISATKIAMRDALNQSHIERSKIKVAEVHDCFTIAELMAIEDLGFFEKGKGGIATQNGETQINGKISINTSGGLKAKGHPVGATGVAQAIEICHQLRNNAGKRQVAGAEYGLAHNVGGSGATAVVHILKRL